MTTTRSRYTETVMTEILRQRRAHARYAAEVEYVNTVTRVASQIEQEIREDDGTDPDLDEAIRAVYSFGFDLAGALDKADTLFEMVRGMITREHRAELRALKSAAGR